ncbi:MAG: dihydrolipoyl dehydrogenase family protein [Thiobacillus sp.]
MHAAKLDLIVIGSGTAGSSIAGACRDAGWTVAVIDHKPFGGTCALRGCDPKKMMVAAAEVIDGAQRMGKKQVVTGDMRIDWASLQAFKRDFTDPVPERSEAHLRARGIEAVHGQARFCGPNHIRVDDRTMSARHIVIAVGAEPTRLPIEGFDHLVTSDDFLALEHLPPRIVLIGGGFIGFEFAHIAARAGAQVTLINRGEHPLSGFDPDLVTHLIARTRALGVDIRLGHTVKAIRKDQSNVIVEAEGPDGKIQFEAELAVHSGGRSPALEPLDLAAGGIDVAQGRIKLDATYRSTSNPAVFAAGDATGGPLPLTPVAALEAKVVTGQLLSQPAANVDYSTIPSVVFTLPPLARVGLQEAEARKQGLAFHVQYASVPDWYTARRVNESAYAYKVLVEKSSGRILGAHLVGPEAAEVINLFALAMQNDLNADAIRRSTFCYPSAASDIAYMLP